MPIRKMKSGHWQITFKLPGHPRYRKVHPEARLKSDAELIEMKLKQRMFDNKWQPTKGGETFLEFTKTYLSWAQQHKRSFRFYKMFVDYLIPIFGKMKLGEISTNDVQKWWDARAQQITRRGRVPSDVTLNRELNQLSGIFTRAITLGKLEINPCRKITKYRVASQRTKVLSPEEEKRILDVLDSEYPFMTGIVRLALLTGMRRGEIFKMKMENLDLEIQRNLRGDVLSYGQIDLPGNITKSGKPRTIPLTQEAREILLDRVGEPYARVFRDVSASHASKIFAWACKVAKVSGAVFHTLRHSFGTRLADRNVNPAVIKDILGHASLKQTEIYIHLDATPLHRAVQTLSEPSGEVHDISVAKKTGNSGIR